MSEMEELFKRNVGSIQLRILIFGPDPNGPTDQPRLNAIRNKRIQIRDYLSKKGHIAQFPEDIVNTNSSQPINNVAFAESILMRDYDAIVAIVETHGSNTETGQIAGSKNIAEKSLMFISDEYTDGYPYQACKFIEYLGGVLNTFSFPDDITKCHLLTKVTDWIYRIQTGKYLS